MIFNLPIENYKEKSKKDIGELIMITLLSLDDLHPNYDYFIFDTIEDLVKYLTSEKTEGNISLKEREISILKSKSLIQFAKGCSGTYEKSAYSDISEVISDAEYVKRYADIPTCRMAIKLLNDDNLCKYKIEPLLSYKVKKQIEKKKKIRAGSQAVFSVKKGHFVIPFS